VIGAVLCCYSGGEPHVSRGSGDQARSRSSPASVVFLVGRRFHETHLRRPDSTPAMACMLIVMLDDDAPNGGGRPRSTAWWGLERSPRGSSASRSGPRFAFLYFWSPGNGTRLATACTLGGFADRCSASALPGPVKLFAFSTARGTTRGKNFSSRSSYTTTSSGWRWACTPPRRGKLHILHRAARVQMLPQ